MAGTQKFQIDNWQPTSVNRLLQLHWYARNALKIADADVVKIAGLNGNITQAKGKRLVRVTVVLSYRQRRSPDDDNLRKSLLDALVKAGYLVDDSPKWCTVEPFVFLKGPKKATIIELEDV